MMSSKIAILGSGLSGLMAAKGLVDAGIKKNKIDILSDNIEKPEPKGFMMLHDNCNMDLQKNYFKVHQIGSEREYKKKLNYTGDISASWKTGLDNYWMVGYNPYHAISMLYTKFRSNMNKFKVRPEDLKILKSQYKTIISTIPPNNLYPGVKLFNTTIWVKFGKIKQVYSPQVIYNGLSDNWMTRSSQLWGFRSLEYCKKAPETTKVVKPIKAKGMPDDNIIKTGRVGQWNKNILAHQVYYKIYGMTKRSSTIIS